MTRFVFTGAVMESWHALDEFIRQGLKPALVCTLKPEYAHRHSDYVDLRPLAAEHGIPVLDFNNMNEPEVVDAIRQIAPDYLVVMGWSQLVREELMRVPRLGCVGFHPTLLPEGRGRAAIPWTILQDKTRSGVTMLYLDESVDAGDIITQVAFDIAPDETAETLYAKVCDGLRQMIRQVAPALRTDHPLQGTPQDHSAATFLGKRVASDGWIDWALPARDIERLVRAVGKPYPGAFTVYGRSKLIIWQARLSNVTNQTGTLGQIMVIGDAASGDDAVTVQCGSGLLDIVLVEEEAGEPIAASRYFTRLHSKLGLSGYDLWKWLTDLNTQEALP